MNFINFIKTQFQSSTSQAWLTELMLKEAQCVTPWTGIGQKVCNEKKKAMKLVKLEEKFFLGVPGKN